MVSNLLFGLNFLASLMHNILKGSMYVDGLGTAKYDLIFFVTKRSFNLKIKQIKNHPWACTIKPFFSCNLYYSVK